MTESFDDDRKQPRKRVRVNHNELERVRRNHQKAQLDILRTSLPFTDMDERASTVKIIVRAKEYIEMLESRVSELQTALNQANIQVPPNPIMTITHPTPEASPTANRQGRQDSMNPDHIHMHQGVAFYNHGLQLANASPASPLSERKGRENSISADLLREFLNDNHPELFKTCIVGNSPIRKRSSSDEDNLFKSIQQRRASSMLMPMANSSDFIYIPARNSITALLDELNPGIIGADVLIQHDVKCSKCGTGMNNMIMIDCDQCHKWYHIKCAHIDSNAIPTDWSCC